LPKWAWLVSDYRLYELHPSARGLRTALSDLRLAVSQSICLRSRSKVMNAALWQLSLGALHGTPSDTPWTPSSGLSNCVYYFIY